MDWSPRQQPPWRLCRSRSV